MEITAVHVRKTFAPRQEATLRAFVDVVFDKEFIVKGFRVLEGKFSRSVAMPGRERADGRHCDVAYALNDKMRRKLETAVLKEYRNHIGQREGRS